MLLAYTDDLQVFEKPLLEGAAAEAAAKAMIDAAVMRLLEDHGNLKRVCFVLFDEAAYEAYREYLTQKFSA